MTKTVEEIDKEVAELLELRKSIFFNERKEVLINVKSLIKKYDIKATELESVIKVKPVSKGKYFNPSDKTQEWSGSGRAPEWFNAYKETGKDLKHITM